MFSAKGDDGKLYVSGQIPDAKSRDYSCLSCDSPVIHVNRSYRGLLNIVAEHFRHPKQQGGHPTRHMTWQTGHIVNKLLENFRTAQYDFETDKVYDVNGTQFATDLTVRDKREDVKPDSVVTLETVVMVESESFGFQPFHDAVRAFSNQGIYSMLIFSAAGIENKNGKYFRDANRRRAPRNLKKISGNEKDAFKLMERNFYFDHDNQLFKQVDFKSYSENVPDPCNPCRRGRSRPRDKESRAECKLYYKCTGYAWDIGMIELMDFKIPVEEFSSDKFTISYWKTKSGLLLARMDPLTKIDET